MSENFFDDERFEDLRYALAMYIPGGDAPHFDSERLRAEILKSLKRLEEQTALQMQNSLEPRVLRS